MERRQFLQGVTCLGLSHLIPDLAYATGSGRLLVLVELKGGNDGLNTVVPYRDPRYAELRPRLALKPGELLNITDNLALHSALQPLMPLWQSGELAVIQSVGYPQPNLSHFRSIEIWDTGSRSDQYLAEGWLARALALRAKLPGTLADGVAVGSSELGPLAGSRALVLSDPEQFRRQARLASNSNAMTNGALAHVLQVESNVVHAASQLQLNHAFQTEFPKGGFGDVVKTACRVAASGNVSVLRLTLGGFDTHQNQVGTQANLLKQLAEGLHALRAALLELGRWQDTLVLTYSEFGRRPRENQSNGTDHGTSAPHFAMGGRVKGGLFGAPPALDRLDGNGNLPFSVDFRSVYATVIERWWAQAGSGEILGGRFKPLEFLRS